MDPPKKKLSKKEKQRLEAEKQELARLEQEKEKQRKLEEERERMEREREEAERRKEQEIIENKMRRKQLKFSMEYFDAVTSIINAIKIELKESDEWDDYMRCNGLPNAHIPGDLRKYLHQWKTHVEIEKTRESNWLLKADEKTLLTQDMDQPDLTWKNLKKQQGNLGDIFAKRIREVLGILTELDRALLSDSLTQPTLIDLKGLKIEIRLMLRNYIDDFTFKILSHVDRDMEVLKPGISKHDYVSEVFKSQILAMRGDANAPKEAKFRVEPKPSEVEFPLLELELSLPPAIKLFNAALRGLWLNYDHYSDICSSAIIPNIKIKPMNLLQQTKKEWKKRKEIIQKTLEEASKIIEPEKNVFGDETETKKSRVIDIDKAYSEYEDEINKARRKAIGPDGLKLTENELNLRRYRIVGGIYCVDYLVQPQQDKKITQSTYLKTIVKPEKLGHKIFHQPYKPPPPPQPGVRRLPEEIEAEIRMVERMMDKLAQISLQLTPDVCWFEPPVVCRWENHAEFEESEKEEPLRKSYFKINSQPSQSQSISSDVEKNEKSNSQMTPVGGSSQQSPRKSHSSLSPQRKVSTVSKRDSESRRQSRKPSSLYKSVRSSASVSDKFSLPITEIEDFDMCNIPHDLDIYGLIHDFVVPRLPEGHTIRLEVESPRKSVNKYLYLTREYEKTPEKLDEEFKRKLEKELQTHKRIETNLLETDSPRSVHPKLIFKKILKVNASSKTAIVLVGKSEVLYETEELIGDLKPYMFSQLLEDLDEIYDVQTSYVTQKLADISSKISSRRSSIAPEEISSPQRKFSGIIIIRDNEVPSGKKIINIEKNEDGESSSEYDDEDGEDEEDGITPSHDDISDRGKYKGKKVGEGGRWSTRDVHDVRFNEDKLNIQFRTGRLGYFGFAANRYSNMPYQTWEIKPDITTENTVLFSLTAAVINVDITVTKDGFCMTTFQGAPATNAINEMIGKTLSMKEMKHILTESSVDLFPEPDAFCYTEGSCEKNFVMEMHLYNCMSTLALSHNFSWSRWNLLSGSRVAVLLMKEFINGKKVPSHSTLYVTPLKTLIVDCTEVSASFTTAGVAGMEYYADLYQLTQVHAHPNSLEKQANIDPVLRDNVAQILMQTRPLSFC
ncbi:dynein axonemal intermediate chain 7 [Condylostylus longicornis]|uniref:dynein axonemal intermediate chain 7 n=1 Tax=Condylostylus longicornis TaxID=2530218 RepID=UPI00244E0726|nr:dynein axonemal intermediate chain 7 [Condylostylus longicornis]